MATKKQATRRTTTTIEETPDDEREELDPFERARLDFSGELGVKLTIYRYDDGDTAYLKRVPYDPESIDEEWIRKKWGAGSYQLRFLDEKGVRHWSKVIHIASDATPGTAPAPASSADGMLLDTLRRQNEIMLQAVLARATAPAAAASAGGSDAIVALIQGMQAQNAELLKSSLNRPDVSSTILQVLERGMSLAAEQRLDAEGGWMAQAARIAKELLPAISEITRARATAMQTVRTLPGAPHPPAGLPPGGAPPMNGATTTNPPSSPPNVATPDGIDIDELIRSYAPSILEAISNQADPADVADTILGFIPPAFYDAFETLTPERAIRAAPALSQHRAYVEQLVAAMRDSNPSDEEGGS